jgi:hypothetical protein
MATATLEPVQINGRTATGALSAAASSNATIVNIVVQMDGPDTLTRNTVVSAEGALKGAQDVLRGEDHPVLVRIWDNPSDAVFDTL